MSTPESDTQEHGQKKLQVKFILQDPRPLTGQDRRELLAPAAVGQNLLNVALQAGIALEHTCGGVCACSTCHVYVNHGAELLSPAQDQELDHLDVAPMVNPKSRLACQASILPTACPGLVQLEIEIPAWNRNAVREGAPLTIPQASSLKPPADGGGGNMPDLRWTDVEEIGWQLCERHPHIDPLTVRFTDLRQWVLALPGFLDDASHCPCNEARLESIQLAWTEEWDFRRKNA